ncbi:MAG TPA: DUF4129 domain-containing protein, partial [Candidatus Thermoplasmatota archaeon]|nr:DUF4129 domain-containing protein [Candidatus Thermoplasmatota archaeon]
GRGVTDARGVWTVTGEVPANAPARPYQLVAHALDTKAGDFLYRGSWTDPEVRVRSTTTLALDLPASDGRNVEVLAQGTLKDSRGKGVPGATVRLEVDGVTVRSTITDGEGRWKTPLIFNEVRTYTVRASFPGDGYNRPSSAEDKIAISNVAMNLSVAVTAVRGEETIVTGSALTADGPLRGRTGVVALPAGFEGQAPTEIPFTTDNQGKFTVKLKPGKNAQLTRYDLTYRLSGVATKAQAVDVVQRPRLALSAPAEVSGDRSIEVSAVLVDDQRAPIANAPLYLTLPGTKVNLSARTGPDGIARFTIPESDIPDEGEFHPVVTYPGAPGTLKAQASATVAVAAGLGPWAWILGGTALALLAVGAVVLGSKKLRGRLVAAAKSVGRSPVAVTVTHPNLPQHLPAAVGPGEPVAFRIAVVHRKAETEEPLAEAPLEMHVAGLHLALTTDAAGVAEFMHTFPATGEFPLTIKVGPTKAVKATSHLVPFRVVEYRRQIEDQYVDLMARLRAKGLPVGEGTTPRDLERALLEAGAEPPEALATLAWVFEVADYSERPVTRAEWRAFSEACAAAEASLDRALARAEAAAPPPEVTA